MNATIPTLPVTARRFPTVPYVIAFGLIILFALAPIISMLIASSVANANGCQLDEAGVHPCAIGGTDWGGTLNIMFVFCWFMFLTIPAGGLAFVTCLIVFIVHRSKWRSRRQAPNVQ